MKKTKIIGITIIFLAALLIITAGLSIYTLFSVLMATVSGENEGIFDVERVVDRETEDWIFTFTGHPKNSGLLEIIFNLRVEILASTGDMIAEESNFTRISPNRTESIVVTLRVVKADIDRYQLGTTGGAMKVEIQIRTLMNLVGMSMSIRIQGEGEI